MSVESQLKLLLHLRLHSRVFLWKDVCVCLLECRRDVGKENGKKWPVMLPWCFLFVLCYLWLPHYQHVNTFRHPYHENSFDACGWKMVSVFRRPSLIWPCSCFKVSQQLCNELKRNDAWTWKLETLTPEAITVNIFAHNQNTENLQAPRLLLISETRGKFGPEESWGFFWVFFHTQFQFDLEISGLANFKTMRTIIFGVCWF